MDWLSRLAELLKLAPRYIVAVAIASSLFIFMPGYFVEVMGLSEVQSTYKPYAAIILIVSLSILLAYSGVELVQWGKRKRESDKEIKQRTGRLHTLTPGEQTILAQYLRRNTRTQDWKPHDGNVLELEMNGVLRRVSDWECERHGSPYNIQPWAWEYLREHSELVGLEWEGEKHVFIRAKK